MMQSGAAQLIITVALPCEARCFIDHFKLTQIPQPAQFKCYENKSKSILLIVSGVGKIKAAAATAYAYAISGRKAHATLLNIGIAGGSNAPLGQLLGVNKITDNATGYSYYPSPIPLTKNVSQTALLTVDKPSADYPNTGLVDMEASAVTEAALSFITKEQMAFLKIVSDSHHHEQQQINPKRVTEWFKRNLTSIEAVINQLLAYSAKLAALQSLPEHYSDFLKNWHFTRYQAHQLQELLRRWQIILPEKLPQAACKGVSDAKTILITLSTTLENAEYG